MWYYRRNRWYRRRGPRRFWFFPVLFFVFLFWGLGSAHNFIGFLVPLFLLVFFFWLFRAILAASRRSTMNPGQRYQQPYYQPPQQHPYQQPYYQPPQPSYQPPTYRPYEQGYQPVPETSQEGEQRYQYPQPSYEQYEQPQAQYPQELPPMEQ
jgi:hypothetical protein